MDTASAAPCRSARSLLDSAHMSMHFVRLLDELLRRSLRMASQVEDILQEACESVFEQDVTLAQRVQARDSEVDREEVEVEKEVVRLMALYQPVGVDLRMLCTVLKVNNDLERIADCAVNIAERASHLEVQPLADGNEELRRMVTSVRDVLRQAVQAYSTEDAELATRVMKQDATVDELYGIIVGDIVALERQAPTESAAHLDLLSVAKNLERIADHATNIAEDVIFLSTGDIVRHQDPQ